MSKPVRRKQNGVSLDFLAAGNSDWIDKVVIPLARDLEQAIPRHIGEIPPPLRQRMTRSAIVNNAVGYAAVGITLYFLKKIADDFYDVMVKPRIRKCFEGLDQKIGGRNAKVNKVFVLAIWHQVYDVVVCVSISGKNFSEIESQLDLMGAVHQNALAWIASRGVSAPVHHYRIEGGAVNAKPLLLARVDEALKP